MMYLSSSLHYLHKSKFKDCSCLEFVSLPDTPKSVAKCKNLLKVNFMNSSLRSIRESCFVGCINLKIVALSRFTNIILQKVFLNCQSIEYVGHDDYLIESLRSRDNKFGIDIPVITEFFDNV